MGRDRIKRNLDLSCKRHLIELFNKNPGGGSIIHGAGLRERNQINLLFLLGIIEIYLSKSYVSYS